MYAIMKFKSCKNCVERQFVDFRSATSLKMYMIISQYSSLENGQISADKSVCPLYQSVTNYWQQTLLIYKNKYIYLLHCILFTMVWLFQMSVSVIWKSHGDRIHCKLFFSHVLSFFFLLPINVTEMFSDFQNAYIVHIHYHSWAQNTQRK